jgi:hypothetical protein
MNRRSNVVVLTAAIVAGGLLAVMVRLDQPLRTAAAPRGIISLELAGSPQSVRRILSSWDPAAHRNARLSLGLDFIFLLVYALTLSQLCLIVARRWPASHRGIRRAGLILGWGQWCAALLDIGENIMLQRILAGDATTLLPLAARWCALAKFTLIGCGWAYILFAGGLHMIRRRLRRE